MNSRSGSTRRAVRALALAATAAVATTLAVQPSAAAPASGAAAKARLTAFDSCAELLTNVKGRVMPLVGPYGVNGYSSLAAASPPSNVRAVDGGPVAVPSMPAPPAAPAPAGAPGTVAEPAPQEGVDYSGTNVQEAGVDEPDIVKTDGRRVFAIANGKLQALTVTGGVPKLVGTLALQDVAPSELLLSGDRLVVIGTGPPTVPPPIVDPVPVPDPGTVTTVAPAPASTPAPVPSIAPLPPGGRLIAPGYPGIYPYVPPATVLAEVDVSNPADMRLVSKATFDGTYVSARLTGTSARVVISSSPREIPLVAPATPDPVGELQATGANRAVVAATGTRNWMLRYKLESASAGELAEGRAVRCRAVARPRPFSGLGMLNVLTLDLAKGMRIADSEAVMSDGNLVYASPTSLYVATQRWTDPSATLTPDQVGRLSTLIHRFDISDPFRTIYRSSGAVPGSLLNQFSMSEANGNLRVASTDEPTWWGGTQPGGPESMVTVLAEEGGALARIGRVGGLGQGERIYAVRFLGDRGYVVTFRRVDPLYVLDLSDPRNPVVKGELKIPGYSSYLHPAGGDLLIGVGQDATPEGRVTGTQVSLFDVADPARPQRLQQLTLGAGWSEAESDHHAFLFWARTGLLVLPVTSYGSLPSPQGGGPVMPFLGAVGVRVSREALTEIARITHPTSSANNYGQSLRRSMVVGGSLLTVSDAGVKASAMDTLADRAWVPFPS
jgi:beta propeller domain-containing protein